MRKARRWSNYPCQTKFRGSDKVFGTYTGTKSFFRGNHYVRYHIPRNRNINPFNKLLLFEGIGYETALALAQHNARVIVACRNVEKGMEAVENLKQESGNTNICFHILDMASFKSVKEFATKIQSTERRLDILVNNAGVTGLFMCASLHVYTASLELSSFYQYLCI